MLTELISAHIHAFCFHVLCAVLQMQMLQFYFKFSLSILEGVNIISEAKVNSVSKKGQQVVLNLDNGLKVTKNIYGSMVFECKDENMNK